jgi:hypothetical protein
MTEVDNGLDPDDPDAKWRRIIRVLHSPAVLGPTVIICTYTAIADLPDTVVKRGWLFGPMVGVAILIGIAVSTFDFVPWASEWALDLHRAVDQKIDAFGRKLERGVERIRRIFRQPSADN